MTDPAREPVNGVADFVREQLLLLAVGLGAFLGSALISWITGWDYFIVLMSFGMMFGLLVPAGLTLFSKENRGPEN